MAAEDIEIKQVDGELVQLTMTVHDAEDIAWCIWQHYSRSLAVDRREWQEFARQLDEFAAARDEFPRPGLQIVLVRR